MQPGAAESNGAAVHEGERRDAGAMARRARPRPAAPAGRAARGRPAREARRRPAAAPPMWAKSASLRGGVDDEEQLAVLAGSASRVTIRSSRMPPSLVEQQRVALLAGLAGRRCRPGTSVSSAAAPSSRGRGPSSERLAHVRDVEQARRARASSSARRGCRSGIAPAWRSRRTAPCGRPARRAAPWSGVSRGVRRLAASAMGLLDDRSHALGRAFRPAPRPLCPRT